MIEALSFSLSPADLAPSQIALPHRNRTMGAHSAAAVLSVAAEGGEGGWCVVGVKMPAESREGLHALTRG